MFKLCEFQSQNSLCNGDVTESATKDKEPPAIFTLDEKHKKEPLLVDLKTISVDNLEKLKKF